MTYSHKIFVKCISTDKFREALYSLVQWFSKWAEWPLGGDFDGQGGEKNKGVDRGAKQHKGGENAQSLIDH